jgi:hypothetical protein
MMMRMHVSNQARSEWWRGHEVWAHFTHDRKQLGYWWVPNGTWMTGFKLIMEQWKARHTMLNGIEHHDKRVDRDSRLAAAAVAKWCTMFDFATMFAVIVSCHVVFACNFGAFKVCMVPHIVARQQ